MTIEKRVYKVNASREEVERYISTIDENPGLIARWTAENSFSLQRSTFSLFRLEGNTDQLENAFKIKISIKTDYRYSLLYILPFIAILAGIFIWDTRDTEQGQLLVFGGFSLSGFIYLISLTVIDRLKKHFKEGFHII